MWTMAVSTRPLLGRPVVTYKWRSGRQPCRSGYAGVAELADAQDSGSCGRKVVEVQVLSPALIDPIDCPPVHPVGFSCAARERAAGKS
jgi:hypothetical protein